MFFRGILVIISCLTALHAAADLRYEAGLGMTSFTSGRQVPSLHLGIEHNLLALTFTSTGYNTRYDYLSGYILSGYQVFEVGELFSSPVRAGFGGGMYYSKRGYREDFNSPVQHSEDFGIGPAFRVGLYPWDTVFISIEAMFAVGSLYNIVLVYQDMAQLKVGVTF